MFYRIVCSHRTYIILFGIMCFVKKSMTANPPPKVPIQVITQPPPQQHRPPPAPPAAPPPLAPVTISVFTLRTDPPTKPPPPPCDVKKHDSGKYLFADCSNKNLSHIPPDLGKENNVQITVMDLTNNPFKEFRSTDLNRYTQLTELKMRNLANIKAFPKDFFSKTVFIEKLDVSGTPISDFGEVSIYLKNLNATNIQAKEINVSHLVSLEELHAKDNTQMARFPLLSSTAPLKKLDVRSCSMVNLTYPDLAPFCLLEYFGMKSLEFEKVNTTQCCGLKNWTTFFKIPGSEEQGCGTGDPCKKMNVTLDLEVVAVRNECLKRTGFLKYLILLAEIFLGVVVTSGVLYFCCINYILKKKKDTYYDYDYDYDYYDDGNYYDAGDYDYDDVEEEDVY